MRIRLRTLPSLPELFFIFLIIIIISLAHPISAGNYFYHPEVQFRIDPPIHGQTDFTMRLKRYEKRNDRLYGHIHFERWQIIYSASVMNGPFNTVCYMEHGLGLGLKNFSASKPFRGFALTGFITCIRRDPTWEPEEMFDS